MPSQVFKIAVIGTHFVGKSTLCRDLVNYLKNKNQNVGMIEEVVRDCPFPVNEMATVQAQDWILTEQKRREKELEQKHDFVVMDRGIIDNFAYWVRVAELNKLEPEKIRQKKEEVFEHSKDYVMILFMQPFDGNKITNDKFRSVDVNWRNEMHGRVANIINNLKANHKGKIFVLKGNKNEVFETAKNYLEKNAEMKDTKL